MVVFHGLWARQARSMFTIQTDIGTVMGVYGVQGRPSSIAWRQGKGVERRWAAGYIL